MTVKERIKNIHYRHYIVVAIVVLSILIGWFVYNQSILRVVSAFKNLGLSIAFYFCELFYINHSIVPAVVFMPSAESVLPETSQGFIEKLQELGRLLISLENIKNYFSIPINLLDNLVVISMISLPLILIVILLVKKSAKKENNDYDKISKPLKTFLFLMDRVYMPIKGWMSVSAMFLKHYSVYLKILSVIWLVNFNAVTILVELLAFIIYFIVSFDVLNIYTQFKKLVMDLSLVLKFTPVLVWVAIGLHVFNQHRKSIGYMRLNHFERKNRGLINSMPVVSLIVGTMGKKKTTTLTDMILSQAVMFREEALRLMIKSDLKFPHFNWLNLELCIKEAMKSHTIYNLVTCQKFIAKKLELFLKEPTKENCFGYDFEKYGFEHNDCLKVENLFEALTDYTKLYFIYCVNSSLIISNYSIRTDNIFVDNGNLPLWNNDFFKRDSKLLKKYSRYAHILDFDMLRVCQSLIQRNKKKNCFEFGVLAMTEGGKERGNAENTKELKKNSGETNRKNDGFNLWLKMIRHSATICNFPFVKVIMDEQRAMSLGADARELCEIVNICETSEKHLAMPMFFEKLLCDLVFSKFVEYYKDYRFRRADNTLLLYLIKSIVCKIYHYCERITNTFAYFLLNIEVEAGALDGQKNEKKYYLMTKKIYSNRFSTDCFSGFFEAKALKSKIGIEDLEEFSGIKATLKEISKENSYFVNDLKNGFGNR